MSATRGALWRVTPFERQDECPPGWPCSVHGLCVVCGELIHLGDVDVSAGFGPLDPLVAARMTVGEPARCAECRR